MRSFVFILVGLFATACNTPSLSPQGGKVAVSQAPPPADCTLVGEVTGKGGGQYGGAWIPNEELGEYAMIDLVNHTAEAGGNYVQHEDRRAIKNPTPFDSVTTMVVKGSAYRCPSLVVVSTPQ